MNKTRFIDTKTNESGCISYDPLNNIWYFNKKEVTVGEFLSERFIEEEKED